MRRALVIPAAALSAALLTGSAGALVYDRANDDVIAEGVSVGGVDIGGLEADDARARLARRLLAPLSRGVQIAHEGRTFRLGAVEARIAADIDGMVRAALARSREGGLPARTWRAVTGEEVQASLPARVTYSQPAVGRLLRRVSKSIDRPARDWGVEADGAGLRVKRGHDGRRVDRASLRGKVVAALRDPNAPRTLAPVVEQVKPKVTRERLADANPVYLVVDRKSFRLRLFKKLKLVKTYGIAVGKVGMDTPSGLYHIQNKTENPAWHVPDSEWAGKLRGQIIPPDDPRNPIEARWMGIYDGAGIHGTTAENSIGSAASHGCIRMRIPEVIELYDEVPVKTPIFIA